MLWIIIFAVSIFLSWKLIGEDHIRHWGVLEYLITMLTIPLGLMIGVLLIILPFDYFLPKTEKYVESIEITALRDNSDMEGSFYLASAYVDEEQYYYYMTNTNKGKKMDKVSAEDSYINETDETPKVDVYDLEYNFIGKVLMFFGSSGHEYIINVPKDTVTTDFNVDMK